MPGRPTVSAVLIVKDEEAVLEACLSSVSWADEIVVYDTGSTDRTVEVARRFTDVVVQGYWDEDFAAARNRALDHATAEWVLSIDADEVLEGSPEALVRGLGRDGATLHTLMLRNVVDPVGLPLSPNARTPLVAVPRVFRRDARRWVGALHEQPAPGGRLSATDRATSISGVTLVHSGYDPAVLVGRDKAERNIAIARAHVEQGRHGAVPALELEARQIHLARTYGLVGQHDCALALADRLLAEGFLSPRNAAVMAPSIATSAHLLGDVEATERWLTTWETHDTTPAFARAARATFAAQRGDAAAALAAVETVPTRTANPNGETLLRSDLVPVEMWAHAALGQGRHAARVARGAVERGIAPGTPVALGELLGHDRTVPVLAALPDGLWREYVTWCAMEATPQARVLLSWMQEARPGDAQVLGALALMAPLLSLEEASLWAVQFRRAGAAQECPLVRIALDPLLDARQRALAGALAYSVYGDVRGLQGLEAALALVPAGDEAELLGQLDVLAPGLVSA